MPTDAVLVRRVRREDRTGWLRLWAAYHAYGRSGATALPNAVTEATWQRFFQGHKPIEALVTEREGRLVGFAHMVFQHSTSIVGRACVLLKEQDLVLEEPLLELLG
jgi:hypothetical protein